MKERYFIYKDSLELITETNLRTIYEETTGDDSYGNKTFERFVNCCCSRNGMLREIPKTDAELISVDSYYYTEGKYGQIAHKGKSYHAYIFYMKSTVSNGNEIDWKGVNSVTLDETENRIFQTSGYTSERGIFCDLY